MVTIVVSDYLDNYVSNDDGDKLFSLIKSHFDNKEYVKISFKGVKGLNTSFVNSAFISLLNYYDFNYIKQNLAFENTTKQINDLILSRFRFETQPKVVTP